MQPNSDLYDLTQTLQGSIFRAAFQNYLAALEEEGGERPEVPAILQLRAGYAESPAWIMVQVSEFLPEPLTVERFRRRAVYSAPGLVRGFLELLASEKYLDRVGEEYLITEVGQKVIDLMTVRRAAIIAGFAPLPDADLQHLESLMRRIIDACLQAADPPGTWCLEHSRSRAASKSAPALDKIVRYCADFNAFRDDCHMAAYHPHNVDGHTWEAFSHVHNGSAVTADDLFETLAYRGFPRIEWRESLQDLAGRGWLEESGSRYAMTETGQTIWHEVEEQTDAYFYAPWDTLSDDQFDRLRQLIQELVAATQNPQ